MKNTNYFILFVSALFCGDGMEYPIQCSPLNVYRLSEQHISGQNQRKIEHESSEPFSDVENHERW